MKTDTVPKWIEASDGFQIPFLLAARQVLQGHPITCPKCGQAALRYYFHIMDQRHGRGTLWAWCPMCRTHCHLPRVSPARVTQVDPYADLDLDQFAELEMDPREALLDRLNRLWDEGILRGNEDVTHG